MSQSKATLIGFYNFMKSSNDDLFLNLSLPSGIDKDLVVDNILLKGGEFEVLLNNPYFLQNAIKIWSSKWSWTFDKWLKAINIEYNPLENYDRVEEWTDNEKSINTNTNKGETNDESESAGEMEDKKSAFNSPNYEPYDKSESKNKNKSKTAVESSSAGTLDKDTLHNGRIHGNLGTMTSQHMLQSELDVAWFNLYDKIADVFLSEFVIPIY